MAGGGGGKRRRSEGGETPRGRCRSSGRSVASAPRGGPPWAPLPPAGEERPLTSRRSLRLRSQKENRPSPTPCAPPSLAPCAPPSPTPCAPHSPSPPPPHPRVRRSYSRLEAWAGGGASPWGAGGRGSPLAPLPCNVPPSCPSPPPPSCPSPLPGISLGPERRKKKKVTPIDAAQLEAWAARVNAQLEEAERFRLVVE